jgi:hypothetical protein
MIGQDVFQSEASEAKEASISIIHVSVLPSFLHLSSFHHFLPSLTFLPSYRS